MLLPMQGAADTSSLSPVFILLRYETPTSPKTMSDSSHEQRSVLEAAFVSSDTSVH